RGRRGALDPLLLGLICPARRLLARRLRQRPQPRLHQHPPSRRSLALLLVRARDPPRLARHLRPPRPLALLHQLIPATIATGQEHTEQSRNEDRARHREPDPLELTSPTKFAEHDLRAACAPQRRPKSP